VVVADVGDADVGSDGYYARRRGSGGHSFSKGTEYPQTCTAAVHKIRTMTLRHPNPVAPHPYSRKQSTVLYIMVQLMHLFVIKH
jgi:hypothetical protein